jgi:hypothetical protein
MNRLFDCRSRREGWAADVSWATSFGNEVPGCIMATVSAAH